MDDRTTKRRGPMLWLAAKSWPFWSVVAFLPLLYVASFGPACWISTRTGHGVAIVNAAYQPLMRAAMTNFDPGYTISNYALLVAAPNWTFTQKVDEATGEPVGPVELLQVPPFF